MANTNAKAVNPLETTGQAGNPSPEAENAKPAAKKPTDKFDYKAYEVPIMRVTEVGGDRVLVINCSDYDPEKFEPYSEEDEKRGQAAMKAREAAHDAALAADTIRSLINR